MYKGESRQWSSLRKTTVGTTGTPKSDLQQSISSKTEKLKGEDGDKLSSGPVLAGCSLYVISHKRTCNSQNGDDTKHCRCVELSCVQIAQQEAGYPHSHFSQWLPAQESGSRKGSCALGKAPRLSSVQAWQQNTRRDRLARNTGTSLRQECAKLPRRLPDNFLITE